MNRFPGRARKAKPGFTLVEILVSLVVLAIGCLAAVAMQSSSMRSGVQAYSLTVASFLAESEIERLKALSRQELMATAASVGASTSLTRDGMVWTSAAQGPCYARTLAALTPNHPIANSVHFSMRVDYPCGARGGQHLVYDTFITYPDFNK